MSTVLSVVLAVLLPPIPAYMHGGAKHCIINIVFCLLGYLPGVAHALWLVFATTADE